MNKYKYFFRSDLTKEAIGMVKAKNEVGALTKAAKKKQLPINKFVEIFFVEEVK